MNTRTLSALALAAALAGCGNPPDAATYVDPKGPRTIVNVGQIDTQDFNMAADALSQRLLASGVLEKAPSQPAVLVVSRITNDTQQQFDTDLFTKNLRIALLQSGKIAVTTTFGPGGQVEDPTARDAGNMQAFLDGQPAPTRLPYYSLTGKILQVNTSAGNTKQSTFDFQLTLTEIKSGLAVWEGKEPITKQGRNPSIGW